MTGESNTDLSVLTDAQTEIFEQRQQACCQCDQRAGEVTTTVTCGVGDRRGLSLLHGICPVRKWNGSRHQMPAQPRSTEPIPDWRLLPPVPHRHHVRSTNDSVSPTSDLFVYGFPGLYAGANTELHHQIKLWRSMGIFVHLIPGDPGYRNEPLYQPMLDLGVEIHQADQFSAITPGAPVLGFCNHRFLANLDQILQYSHNTVFINCMTWLFDIEKQRMREGKLAALLYQNEEVRSKNEVLLRQENSDPSIQFLTFRPFFDNEAFAWTQQRDPKRFTIGRISRQDADKYASNTLDIWNRIDAPMIKRGIMLGFGPRSHEKIGPPPSWITTYGNHLELSQQDFYRQCDVIVQSTDTTENWPRIGLEAMSSGSVLIVDNRGGWRQMIQHGESGWLCDDASDFVRFASRMAHNPLERHIISCAARERLHQIAGHSVCASSWRDVLEKLNLRVPE